MVLFLIRPIFNDVSERQQRSPRPAGKHGLYYFQETMNNPHVMNKAEKIYFRNYEVKGKGDGFN